MPTENNTGIWSFRGDTPKGTSAVGSSCAIHAPLARIRVFRDTFALARFRWYHVNPQAKGSAVSMELKKSHQLAKVGLSSRE